MSNNFSSSFQYISKSMVAIESDIPEKMGKLEENLLTFSGNFSTSGLIKSELVKIAKELESTAYYFGKIQGLDRDISGEPSNLLNHTKAIVFGRGIEFKNDAIDKYGRFYAGFVEYGHFSGKSYIPARPFMRPALYAVAKASQGQLADAILTDLMENLFRRGTTSGYQGVQKLHFEEFLGVQYHKSKSSNMVASLLSQEIKSNDKFSEKALASNLSNRLSLKKGGRGFYQNRIRQYDANLRKDGTSLNRDTKVKQKEIKKPKEKKSLINTKKASFHNASVLEAPSKKTTRKQVRKRTKKTKNKNTKKASNTRKTNSFFSNVGPYFDEYGRRYVVLNGKKEYI